MLKFFYFLILFSFTQQLIANDYTEQAHSKARLVSETQNLHIGTNWLGLWVELDDHWHTYWINPGDSASAPYFNFQLPEGVRLTKIHYPRPKRIEVGPLQSFAYEKEVLFLFELQVDTELQGEKEIVLDSEWLVCKEECIPGIFTFKIHRKFSTSKVDSEFAKHFSHFKSQLPLNIDKMAKLEIEKERVNLSEWTGFDETVQDIFPMTNQLVSNIKPRQENKSFHFDVSENKKVGINKERFLVLTENKTYELGAQVKVKEETLWMMLLFAFLGGLLLNLMPCVFPVLGIKVYSLIQQKQKSKTEVLLSNLSYVFGILVSFWLLALIISMIRSAGTSIGWGFQLQSPLFVGFLIVLFLLMTLIFLDILPLSFAKLSNAGEGLTKKQGHLGSFFTGVLAVVVASPCTAPFMGAAMGYALSQSYLFIFMIFTALGLGLAFPFLIFSFYPNAFKILPQPGAWMVTFKKLMAIPLILTMLWLGWVLALQTGVGFSAQQNDGLWSEFSQESLERELKDGKKVFINFTAAWCITCQVNERLVFQNEKIKNYFKQQNIVPMKADWTKKDDKIGNILKKYNRAGVPLYLFYEGSRKEAKVLPEILTVDLLISNLTTTKD